MTDLTGIQRIFDLSGKTALVTGGAMGIGEGIARRLAQAGANVMISDINDGAAQAAAKKISEAGGTVKAVQADSSKPEDIRRVTQATVEAFGGLDILVNNAGIFPSRPVLEIDLALWRRVIDLNLTGAFLHAQEAAKVMVERGVRGKIINIASIDALHPSGSLVHYDSSKAGVAMMTKSMAAELGKYGITVNAIAPGAIATPGVAGGSSSAGASAGEFEEVLRAFMARIPLGRMGQPDDIALPVLFLASRASDYMTGDVMVVDGGFLLS